MIILFYVYILPLLILSIFEYKVKGYECFNALAGKDMANLWYAMILTPILNIILIIILIIIGGDINIKK